MDDACGENVRLAGARTGDDEQGSGAVLDGAALLVGEAAEDVGLRFAEPEGELFGHARARALAVTARSAEALRSFVLFYSPLGLAWHYDARLSARATRVRTAGP